MNNLISNYMIIFYFFQITRKKEELLHIDSNDELLLKEVATEKLTILVWRNNFSKFELFSLKHCVIDRYINMIDEVKIHFKQNTV